MGALELKQHWRRIDMTTKIKKIFPFLAIVLIALSTLAACSSTAQGTVNVRLNAFSITMPARIKSGQVTFHVTNIDTTDTHSFIILKTDLAPGSLPLDSSNNVILTAQGVTRVDGINQLAPNAVQDLIVNLQPGKYVAICHLPGHYQAGMYAGFTVE
jgi:uncharacterized cupredoxin-like copper-binding protein